MVGGGGEGGESYASNTLSGMSAAQYILNVGDPISYQLLNNRNEKHSNRAGSFAFCLFLKITVV